MGQGREAGSSRLVAPSLHHQHITLLCWAATAGAAGAPHHPDWQMGQICIHCSSSWWSGLCPARPSRNREEFSRAGGGRLDWSCGCNVQSSSVSLLSLMRN